MKRKITNEIVGIYLHGKTLSEAIEYLKEMKKEYGDVCILSYYDHDFIGTEREETDEEYEERIKHEMEQEAARLKEREDRIARCSPIREIVIFRNKNEV